VIYFLTGDNMPNRRKHVAVGAPAGLAFAAVNSLNQGYFNSAIELLGGLCGGGAGAALPDIVDPPCHPGHRSLGHGIVPVGSAAAFWAKNLPSWQNGLRELADQHRAQRIAGCDWLESFGHLLIELILRFLAGFAAGVGAGYISHIILDLGTPCRIPLVV
jgi:hypothetical protein